MRDEQGKTTGDMSDALRAGFNRGAAASTSIIKDIHAHAGKDADYWFGYLATHIGGLMGAGAATLGHDRARELWKEIGNTVETGLAMIESGVGTRVN